MEEIEELRAKVIASMSTHSNPNPKPKENPIGIREEGELSSSDSDEIHACSPAQPTNITAPSIGRSNAAPPNKHSGTSNVDGPVSSGRTQLLSVKQNHRKYLETSPAPSRPGNHQNSSSWYLPSGTNNNLVIRFSDDDSGSDSEEYKPEKSLERNVSSIAVDASKRQLFQSKADMLQRTSNNQVRTVPKKLPLSRTFITSMTKINGATSRGSRPSLEQASRVRNLDSVSKMLASCDRVHNQGMNLNNNNLESLRQQIAIRENELRLQYKSAQKNKETTSSSRKGYSGGKLTNNAVGKGRTASANTIQPSPNERENKRLKLDETCQNKLKSVCQQQKLRPASKSVSEPKMSSMNNTLTDRELVVYSQYSKEIPEGTKSPSTDERRVAGDEQNPVPSSNLLTEVKDGGGVSMNCNQSEKSAKLMGSHTSLNQSSLLMQMTSRVDDGPACQLRVHSPKEQLGPTHYIDLTEGYKTQSRLYKETQKNTDMVKFPSRLGGIRSSMFQNKSASEHLVRGSEYNEISSGDRTLKPISDSTCHKCSLHVLESNMRTSDAFPNTTCLLNCSGQLNLLGHDSMDIESLAKIEELQDKELEEAQEHRRHCELEERKALKAYRKAQRALVEANARCTLLYRRRELFSAQLRAFTMEGSNSLWSSGWNKCTEIGLNSSNIVPEANLDQSPTLGHQMQAELEELNQLAGDSNIQCRDGTVFNAPYQPMSGQNLGSEPCSEPDASTSEPLHHKDNSAVNGVCTPSNHPDVPADEDEETFPFDNKSVQCRSQCDSKQENIEKEMGFPARLERKYSIDSIRDPALLEASLRSELFARLGTNILSKESGIGLKRGCTIEKGTGSDFGNKTADRIMGNQTVLEVEQNQVSSTGVRGASKLSLQITDKSCGDKSSLGGEFNGTVNSNEDKSYLKESHSSITSVSVLPSSDVRCTFGYVKFKPIISISRSQTANHHKCLDEISHEEHTGVGYNEIMLDVLRTTETSRGRSMGEMGSYTCDLSIDPLWPLCMFELRGKCNNEECSWQHFRDYSQRNMKQIDDSDSSDCHVKPSSPLEKPNRACIPPQCLNYHPMPAPVTYLVGTDLLKADLHSCESILARSIGQCWQRGFSTSLSLPFCLQRNIPSDASLLRHSDSWTRQSLYFHSQDEAMRQVIHGSADPEQVLEMAFIFLNQEVNKVDGKKKALSVLSRSLETDPTSVVLWIVYLHIYYRDEKAIGTDDMFFHAIHHNEGSYELWLMYINSRLQLDDQLLAYDNALLALCRIASSPDRDIKHASACILDLFLQMMDLLCMSGDVGKAIQRIQTLLLTVKDCSSTHSLLLSDILVCLTVSDKCIFWVCCLYLVIYKKMPDAVVRQFEFEKEFHTMIEWPSVQLTPGEKQLVVQLMEMAVGSVASSSDTREAALRSAHLLAVSHVRCMAALEGLDYSKNLLGKYLKKYPTCLELFLLSARLNDHEFEGLGFEGFEEALSGWPSDTPGVQCIWNQYAEYALENGKVNLAKELMVRWFQSVWKAQCPQNEKTNSVMDNELLLLELPLSVNQEDSSALSNTRDALFGLLNLSLHRLLQKDLTEARRTIDRALKVASPKDYEYCVREHARFLLADCSEPMEDTHANEIVSFLSRYLVDDWSFPSSQPLSRKFIENIKKPRLRQLINNILGPVSFDCSLINSVLEAWHGPSLLPEKFGQLKDFVDLVEAIMEISPANYQLALSICKLMINVSNSGAITSHSVVFWASSLLVNSIFQTVPVAPEPIWVEAAGILGNLEVTQSISERFHQRALSVYPFSISLWKSFFKLSSTIGNITAVVEAARERGIRLD
ncbi:PREDICTED: uncharacterized protein LOC104599318 isoform X2 [Nelumbo nucifera]|uniref:Uncharacterized protein LOC104599318 isoform X2 n=1 Tax=Nelumbo nucifera TaxID=4432 RepID=A0A1U8A1N7_NELNU|nr:PREDICTED: uncharacterized protein LOC104599318 isoform X2 [Nelumbo nucifera]